MGSGTVDRGLVRATGGVARALSAAVLVVAAGGCRDAGAGAPAGATLLVGRPVDARGLDPAREATTASGEVCDQIFDSLVRFRGGTMEVEPALAVAWETSPDGTQWTFHLRAGVRFQDGTPLDAEAVAFSFERQIDPKSPYHTGSFAWEDTYREIVRIDRLDPLTVRFTIARPYVPFLATLAMVPASIVSPTAVAKWGAGFSRHPVGTGPFELADWAPGERIVLARNPYYWGDPPRIDHLVFRAIPDVRQRLVALESGAIDVAYSISPDDAPFVALHPNLRLLSVEANGVVYLAINTRHPPLDDVRVRRAINHAIDREAIVKLLYQGRGEIARGVLPPSMWAHEDDFQYDYDPARARALLAAAGYRAAAPLALYVSETERSSAPHSEQMARAIASQLAAVGIPVRIVVMYDLASDLGRMALGAHDLALLNWVGDDGDPDDFLYNLFDSEQLDLGPDNDNLAFYSNPAVDGLLAAARRAQDRPSRARLYREAQRIIADDAPWVPIAYNAWTFATRAAVHGLVLRLDSLTNYARAWIE